MSRADELLDYLRRKGCALSRSRILEDLRWPAPELDTVLSLLMRGHQVRAPRPGEYEVMPVPLNHEVAAVPSPPASRAMETIVHKPVAAPRETPPAITQETPMAKAKTCTKCGDKKGPTGFPKGSDVCRLCSRGDSPTKVNRAAKSLKDVAARHTSNGNPFAATVEKLRPEAAKYSAAADALEALGA